MVLKKVKPKHFQKSGKLRMVELSGTMNPTKISVKQFMTTPDPIFGPNFHYLFAPIMYYLVIPKKKRKLPVNNLKYEWPLPNKAMI